MFVSKMRIQVGAQPSDYFFLRQEPEAKTFCLTLTDGHGGPVHIGNLSKRQVFQLLNQAQKAVLAADEADLDLLASGTGRAFKANAGVV